MHLLLKYDNTVHRITSMVLHVRRGVRGKAFAFSKPNGVANKDDLNPSVNLFFCVVARERCLKPSAYLLHILFIRRSFAPKSWVPLGTTSDVEKHNSKRLYVSPVEGNGTFVESWWWHLSKLRLMMIDSSLLCSSFFRWFDAVINLVYRTFSKERLSTKVIFYL